MDAVGPEGNSRNPIAAFAERVRAVQAQLSEALALAGFRRDPYRHVIEAEAALIDLYPEMVSLINSAHQPLNDKDIRRIEDAAIAGAANGANRHVVEMVRATNWRTMIVGILGMAALCIACAAGGYWLRGSAPSYAGVRAGVDKCADQDDGSRVCWIPIFERLPAAKSK
jgi:hypothetical protein